MTYVGWVVSTILCAFTLRRCLYLIASLLPPRPAVALRTRSITVLITARNEQAHLPNLLAALEQSDYPDRLLNFVLVSDGSTDSTPDIIDSWVARRTRAQSLLLPASQGKGAALQSALALAPPSDLIAVLDADTQPSSDALAWLAGAFEDPATGAACGYLQPFNTRISTTSRYASLERFTTHLVTLAGKDRLALNPPAIGALCCFRRSALEQIGGFSGALAEDISTSFHLVGGRWKTRWIRNAVAREDVPADLNAFKAQRLRWSQGLMATATSSRTLEDLFVAAGYLDRLAFLSAVLLTALGVVSIWVPLIYAAAPIATSWAALHLARADGKLSILFSIVPMTFADIAITAESLLAFLFREPARWTSRDGALHTRTPSLAGFFAVVCCVSFAAWILLSQTLRYYVAHVLR